MAQTQNYLQAFREQVWTLSSDLRASEASNKQDMLEFLHSIMNIGLKAVIESQCLYLAIEVQDLPMAKRVQLESLVRKIHANLSEFKHLQLKCVIRQKSSESLVAKVTPAHAVKTKSITTKKHRRRIPAINRIVAIGSGKGGVGKSSVAANLATLLAKRGVKVGLLDADIYGPSQHIIFGLEGIQHGVNEGNRLETIEKYGVKHVGFGSLNSDQSPVIWRGPQLSKALIQLCFDVEWGELDVLILDLPPGTGDIQLTLTQDLAVDAAIVVTTAQKTSIVDAKKSYKMFEQAGITVLATIINMAYFICGSCDAKHFLFGNSRELDEFSDADLHFLPIITELGDDHDLGVPAVVTAKIPLLKETLMTVVAKIESL